MTFLNLGALFGLAAVSIPIIIHLLNRMQVREVHWAAMRFLLESVQKNQRRLQIEDMILLILRCLLIALLILALSRPTWQTGPHSTGSHQVTAVLILDDSYSMGLTNGIQTSFQRAQSAAEQILQTFPTGSSAALFFAANNVQPAIALPTLDFNLLRKTIRQAKLTDRSTDLGEALQLAIATLEKQSSGSKEIYVITDGQANGWGSLDQLQKQLSDAQKQIILHVVLVGGESQSNLGVTGLRLEGGLTPVGQPLRCAVEVTNESESEARDVRVSLIVDDQPAVDETIIDHIAPGTARSVALFAKFRTDGYHSITARIPPDRLPADDQRTIAVRAINQVKVLLVQGSTPPSPSEADDFFIRNALVPVAASEVSQYYIKTTTINATQLPSTALDDYDAVFLLDVDSFDPSEIPVLSGYVRQGGGLVVFPGPDCRTEFYNQEMGRDGFLPATLGAMKGNATDHTKFFSLQTKDYDHPIVTLWNDPASGTLAPAHFYAYYPLTPQPWKAPAPNATDAPSGQPRVIAHFVQNDDPFAVEHTWGAGRLILFASSATLAWNDLPTCQAYVPLIQRVLGSLVERQAEGLNIQVGQKFSYIVSNDLIDKDVSVTVPGQTDPPRVVGQVTLNNALPTVEFDDTDLSGPYHLSVAGSPPTPILFAAQSDPNESNLTPLSADQLKTLGTVADIIKWSPEGQTDSLAPKLASARLGVELWWPLLITALIIATVETFLAQRFSQSK
ncbi:MAG: BatA domain-containing protein [Methylacidiphilales bacterium]|nr:BatA domain-containing protein [Candidatus Methylacidiphilales bacterium]